MTKAEEIATLQRFASSLPTASYLRSAIEPFVPEFEAGVYSDIVPSVRDSWQARVEAEKEAREIRQAIELLRKERDKLQAEVAAQIRRLEKANDSLVEISSSIDVASRAADRAASSARSLLS